MNIELLLKSAKESAKKLTTQERFKMLVDAKILTKNGSFNSRFFNKETVQKSKV